MIDKIETSMRTTLAILAAGVVLLLVLVFAPDSKRSLAARTREAAIPLLGTPGAPGTSLTELRQAVTAMEARLSADPHDDSAAVRLADTLLRLTRATGNAGLALRAERCLRQVLSRDSDHYQARRMLAAVLLSQHRFGEAIAEARRCLQARGDDPWLYAVIGDGHLEIGEYDEAFAAFDRALAQRPDATGYARASYARELQGDLEGAVDLMRMALEATSPSDHESLAWCHTQLGHLHLSSGNASDARREFQHANFAFPSYPLAAEGLARALAAQNHDREALDVLKTLNAAAPAPSALVLMGDLLSRLGRQSEAERHYLLAEAAWQSDAPDPAALARFLADRGRRLPDAVRLAEQAAADRHDIFTDDALAWVYFKTGRLERARAASDRALRTGSHDPLIRAHAAAIARAAAVRDAGRPARQ